MDHSPLAAETAERVGDGTLDFDFGVGDDPLARTAFDLRTASGVFVGNDEAGES